MSIENAIERVLATLKTPDIAKLRSIEDCPESTLKLMSIERGIEDWQHSDSEEQKRAALKSSSFILAKAGTRVGIQAAIESLGYSAKVENGSKPFEVSVTLLDTRFLNQQETDRLSERINEHKSARDDVVFKYSRHSSCEINLYTKSTISKRVYANG